MNDYWATESGIVAARSGRVAGWWNAQKTAGDPSQQAHPAQAAEQIEQFQKDPKKLELVGRLKRRAARRLAVAKLRRVAKSTENYFLTTMTIWRLYRLYGWR